MEIEKLSEFSKAVYKLVAANYPQWIPLMKDIPEHKGAWMLEISCPHDPMCKLSVYTDNEEITLGFDYAHSHFGWSDVPDTEAFARAKEQIDAILRDEWLIASEIRNGMWLRSHSFRIEYLEEMKKNHPEINRIVGWSKVYL